MIPRLKNRYRLTKTEYRLVVSTQYKIKIITKGQINKKVQVGKDQEKAQSEKDSHSKNRGGKSLDQLANLHSDTLRDLAPLS